MSSMINKDRTFFQYNSGDLVNIIPFTSQLRTIKWTRPWIIYKIIDPHNYLLMTLVGKIL